MAEVSTDKLYWGELFYLQDDIIEADEILRTGPSFVLISLRFLEFCLQSMSHTLIPLHQCTQLDVGQVTVKEEQTINDSPNYIPVDVFLIRDWILIVLNRTVCS